MAGARIARDYRLVQVTGKLQPRLTLSVNGVVTAIDIGGLAGIREYLLRDRFKKTSRCA